MTDATFDGVHPARAAFAAVLALAMGALFASGVPVGPATVVTAALVLGFFVANAFDVVREHHLYRVLKTTWTAAILGLLVGFGFADGVLPLALFAAACLLIGVELYNHRHGTDYLHVDA